MAFGDSGDGIYFMMYSYIAVSAEDMKGDTGSDPLTWIRYIKKLQDGRGGKRKRYKIFWQAQ